MLLAILAVETLDTLSQEQIKRIKIDLIEQIRHSIKLEFWRVGMLAKIPRFSSRKIVSDASSRSLGRHSLVSSVNSIKFMFNLFWLAAKGTAQDEGQSGGDGRKMSHIFHVDHRTYVRLSVTLAVLLLAAFFPIGFVVHFSGFVPFETSGFRLRTLFVWGEHGGICL